MENPFASAFRPEQLYAASAERFFELLKSFSPAAAPGAGAPPDFAALAGPLAAQFEQWLKLSQSAGPWFTATPNAAPGMPPGAPFGVGPLPLGPGAVPHAEAQRGFEILMRLSQLQAQLGAHWAEIARSAAQRFVARAGSARPPASAEDTLRLYQLWVQCAEEAYAGRARSAEFAQLQSELANVSAALLVEQRRQAESLVRAFGLPTRTEVDALYAHVKDLSRRLGELEGPAPKPRPKRPKAATSRRARSKGRRA